VVWEIKAGRKKSKINDNSVKNTPYIRRELALPNHTTKIRIFEFLLATESSDLIQVKPI